MKDRHALTFSDLRVANLERCGIAFHALDDWSPTDWGTAVAGEVGEALNLIKKLRRGDPVARPAIASELADAVIYLDLLAARLGIDLGRAVAYKFNRVSERKGVGTLLLLPDPGTPCQMWHMPADRLEDEETAFPLPRRAPSECDAATHTPPALPDSAGARGPDGIESEGDR